MSLKIRTEAHARKMKVISFGTTIMGKYVTLSYRPGMLDSQVRTTYHSQEKMSGPEVREEGLSILDRVVECYTFRVSFII
jgi:hypothetical protein